MTIRDLEEKLRKLTVDEIRAKMLRLTITEAEVFYYKLKGRSAGEISEELSETYGKPFSGSTVENIIREAYKKIDLDTKLIHASQIKGVLDAFYVGPFMELIDDDPGRIPYVFKPEIPEIQEAEPLDRTGQEADKAELKATSNEVKATDDQIKAGSAESGEAIPRDGQRPATDGEVPVVPGFPRRLLLIGIPLLLVCAVCAFLGWRIVVPMLGNDSTATVTLTIPMPQATETSVPATNTPLIVATETSLPTATDTAIPPTLTGTPTNTPLPTESPTSSIPALFFDDFNNGKSSEWVLIYGSDPVIVNGSLTFNDNTQMIIDQEWTDYDLSFYVKNMQCQEHVSSRGLTVGLRVQDANNMVALRINDQDYCGGTWIQIQNGNWNKLPNTNFKLPPVDSNQGRQITIRVQGNTFSTPIGTSVVIENYATGGISFIGAPGVTVDNVRVTPLTP